MESDWLAPECFCLMFLRERQCEVLRVSFLHPDQCILESWQEHLTPDDNLVAGGADIRHLLPVLRLSPEVHCHAVPPLCSTEHLFGFLVLSQDVIDHLLNVFFPHYGFLNLYGELCSFLYLYGRPFHKCHLHGHGRVVRHLHFRRNDGVNAVFLHQSSECVRQEFPYRFLKQFACIDFLSEKSDGGSSVTESIDAYGRAYSPEGFLFGDGGFFCCKSNGANDSPVLLSFDGWGDAHGENMDASAVFCSSSRRESEWRRRRRSRFRSPCR